MKRPALAGGGGPSALLRLLLVPALVAVCTSLACERSSAARLHADGAAPDPVLHTRRPYPDTTSRIAVFADQLPGGLTAEQYRFAATHYAGTQKLTLDQSSAVRAVSPDFLVLHYKLAMWQSAPRVSYITDGVGWSNDFDEVTRHESWFWHNPDGQRVTSSVDGKFLMNIGDPGFRAYWRDVLVRQVQAGDYDGVFFDSASPALLQWEARSPVDPRLLRSGARYAKLPELGNRSWIEVWNEWMADLNRHLADRGVPVIPNVGGLTTSWDDTDYGVTAGVFCEGYLDPAWNMADWTAAVDATLALVRRNKIVILQNYVKPSDVDKRMYLLAGYLLVKGSRTYVNYFETRLDWYPEWALDLGAPPSAPASARDLRWQGVYRRDYEKGAVIVNPTAREVTVTLEKRWNRVVPSGGGAVDDAGRTSGSLRTEPVLSSLTLAPKTAAILVP